MTVARYYFMVLRTALRHSLSLAQDVIFGVIVLVGLAALVVKHWPKVMPGNDLQAIINEVTWWGIGLYAFLAIFIVRLFLAPFWVYQQQNTQLNEQRARVNHTEAIVAQTEEMRRSREQRESEIDPYHQLVRDKQTKALREATHQRSQSRRLGISHANMPGTFDNIELLEEKVAWSASVALSNLGNVSLQDCCLYLESVKPNPLGIGPIRLTDSGVTLDVGTHVKINIVRAYLEGEGEDMVRTVTLNNPNASEYGRDEIGIPLGTYDITLRAMAGDTPEAVATFRLRLTPTLRDLGMERLEA